MKRSKRLFLAGGGLVTVANAAALPEPTLVPAKVEARAPVITAVPVRHSFEERDIVSDILSGADSVLNSLGDVFGYVDRVL